MKCVPSRGQCPTSSVNPDHEQQDEPSLRIGCPNNLLRPITTTPEPIITYTTAHTSKFGREPQEEGQEYLDKSIGAAFAPKP